MEKEPQVRVLLKIPAHFSAATSLPCVSRVENSRSFAHSSHLFLPSPANNRCLETFTKEAVELVAARCGDEEQETTTRTPGRRFAGRGSPSTSLPAPLLSTALRAAMHPAGILLVVCGLVLGATGDPSQGKRGPPHRPGAVSLTPNPVPKARSRGPHSSCHCGEQASAEGDWGGLGTGEVPSVPHRSRGLQVPKGGPPRPLHGDSAQGSSQAVSI